MVFSICWCRLVMCGASEQFGLNLYPSTGADPGGNCILEPCSICDWVMYYDSKFQSAMVLGQKLNFIAYCRCMACSIVIVIAIQVLRNSVGVAVRFPWKKGVT